MIFIIGGEAQGKTAYAKQKFQLSNSDILDGEFCGEEILSAKCIKNYHLLLKKSENPIILTERLCQQNPDVIVIMNEIGCGIIPIEKSERIWRETVGKCGCILAAHADIVIRMLCGIPEIIKENCT